MLVDTSVSLDVFGRGRADEADADTAGMTPADE